MGNITTPELLSYLGMVAPGMIATAVLVVIAAVGLAVVLIRNGKREAQRERTAQMLATHAAPTALTTPTSARVAATVERPAERKGGVR